jgi:hypothetical protein
LTSRAGGLEIFPTIALDELINERSTYVDKTKTGKGVAYTATSPITSLYLTIYRIVKLTYFECQKMVMEDYAFLNMKGRQFSKIGDCVNVFFKPYDLDITTTDIRSLQETTISRFQSNGQLQDIDRNYMASVIGHSKRTANIHYVKENTRHQSKNSSLLFQDLIKNDTEYQRNENITTMHDQDISDNDRLNTSLSSSVTFPSTPNSMIFSNDSEEDNDIMRNEVLILCFTLFMNVSE